MHMTYWIIGATIAIALILLAIMIYRVMKEVGPTMKAAQKAMTAMQRASEQSQEIVYHLHSISEIVAVQSQQIQIIRAYAMDSIEQVKEAASLIKPIQYTYRGAKALYQQYQNGTQKSWVSKMLEKVL